MIRQFFIGATTRRYAALAVLLALVVRTPSWAKDVYYIPTGKVDAVQLLPPPPQDGSAEQKADLATVESVFKNRTPQEKARGQAESDFNLFSFAPDIGSFFVPDKLPKTEALFKRVMSDTKIDTDAGKKYWKRLRPYEIDPQLLEGEKEPSPGYPSGHSTRATVYALLLAEMFPNQSEQILSQGRQIGWDRVILGKHYPTDVYAGRVLGQAIVRQLHANPEFEHDFAEAKAEVQRSQSQTAQK